MSRAIKGQAIALTQPGRLETEAWVTHLASILPTLLSSPSPPSPTASPTTPRKLKILDLCTGTGCIPLLMHSLLFPPHPPSHTHTSAPSTPTDLQITALDISPTAIRLARKNLVHNIAKNLLAPSSRSQIRFTQGDIFDLSSLSPTKDGKQTKIGEKEHFDIVLANPPYISPFAYDHSTERSVRNFEPKLALVPSPSVPSTTRTRAPDPGDTFYPAILAIAERVRARVVAMEVADLAQAQRVAGMMSWRGREVWRDRVSGGVGLVGKGEVEVEGSEEGVVVRGEGNGRCVVGWR
ncbi:MAG: hypothetical protein Q9202_007325 [Teloschistes flavicans]